MVSLVAMMREGEEVREIMVRDSEHRISVLIRRIRWRYNILTDKRDL